MADKYDAELDGILTRFDIDMGAASGVNEGRGDHEMIMEARNEAKAKLSALLREAYRHGYNDNARDCNCNEFNIKPHQHLMDDGKSHDIRPDIALLPRSPQEGENDE